MDFYKRLDGHTDYTINPFKSYANQRYTIISGSTGNPQEVSINRAEAPTIDWTSTGNIGTINDVSGIPSYTLFSSINFLYYESHSFAKIPYSANQIVDKTKYIPSQSCFVVDISQYAYGETVKPGTFSLDVNGSIYDVVDQATDVPGLGLLYVSSSNNVVGNIFYDSGLAVIKENRTATTGSIDPIGGVAIKSGSVSTITFNSQVTIYQHRVVCMSRGHEFNYSVMNPSTRISPLTGSGSRAMADGVANAGSFITDAFQTGSLTPYVTTIGLYNDQGDLLVIGKLSSPIKRTKFVEQTFIIQFDSIT